MKIAALIQALLAIPSIVVGIMWVRSFYVPEVIARNGSTCRWLTSDNGALDVVQWSFGERLVANLELQKHDRGWKRKKIMHGLTITGRLSVYPVGAETTRRNWFGCWYLQRRDSGGPFPDTLTELFVPFPMLFTLSAAPPALWFLTLRRTCKRAWRLERGLCPVCGYDLCATPERCPECGAEPSATYPSLTARGAKLACRAVVNVAPVVLAVTATAATVASMALFVAAGLALACGDRRLQFASGSEDQAAVKWPDAWSEFHRTAATCGGRAVTWRLTPGKIERDSVTASPDAAYVAGLLRASIEHHERHVAVRGAAASAVVTDPPAKSHVLFNRSHGFLGVSWSARQWQESIPMFDPSATGEDGPPTKLVRQTTSVRSIGVSYATIMLATAILPAWRFWRWRRGRKAPENIPHGIIG